MSLHHEAENLYINRSRSNSFEATAARRMEQGRPSADLTRTSSIISETIPEDKEEEEEKVAGKKDKVDSKVATTNFEARCARITAQIADHKATAPTLDSVRARFTKSITLAHTLNPVNASTKTLSELSAKYSEDPMEWLIPLAEVIVKQEYMLNLLGFESKVNVEVMAQQEMAEKKGEIMTVVELVEYHKMGCERVEWESRVERAYVAKMLKAERAHMMGLGTAVAETDEDEGKTASENDESKREVEDAEQKEKGYAIAETDEDKGGETASDTDEGKGNEESVDRLETTKCGFGLPVDGETNCGFEKLVGASDRVWY